MEKKELKFWKVKINSESLNTIVLDNRFVHQDVRIILLTEYRQGKLQLREELEIKKYEKNSKLQKDDVIDLICKNYKGNFNLKIGKVKYLREENDSIFVKPIKIYIEGDKNYDVDEKSNIYSLFELSNMDRHCTNLDTKIKEYIKEYGLFYYYYKFLLKALEYNKNYFNISKLSALCCYEIAKDYFERKGKNVSAQNVFIKNFNVEFDLLLLKKGIDNQKLVYEKNEVEKIVELKTRGIFYKKDDVPDKFEKYVKFELGKDRFINLSKDYKEYIGNASKSSDDIMDYSVFLKEIQNIDYIYFCLDETSRKSKTNSSKKNGSYYKMTYNILKKLPNHEGLFFTTTDDYYHYIIPIDLDLK